MANTFDQCHLAVPLRNDKGGALAVLDVNIGMLSVLPPAERHIFIDAVKLLQTAVLETMLDSHMGKESVLPRKPMHLNNYRLSRFQLHKA